MQCKDPTKIPKERLYVFNNKIHLILFSPEGYEQLDSNSDGGSDKGDANDQKGDENIDGDLPEGDLGEDGNGAAGDKTKDLGLSELGGQNSKNNSAGSK